MASFTVNGHPVTVEKKIKNSSAICGIPCT